MPSLAQNTRAYLAILLGAISAYILLALISYNPTDISYYASSLPPQVTTNLGGARGADIAARLFYYTGISSFLLPVWLVLLSVNIIKQTKPLTAQCLQGILSFIAVLSAIPLVTSDISWRSFPINAAGTWGTELAGIFSRQIGTPGHCILLAAIGISFFHKSLGELIGRISLPRIKIPGSEICGVFLRKVPHMLKLPRKTPKMLPTRVSVTDTSSNLDNPVTTPPVLANESRPDPVGTIAAGNLTKSHPLIATPYQVPKGQEFRAPQVAKFSSAQKQEFQTTAARLTQVLHDFGVNGQIKSYQPGPVVTVYEFQPKSGTKLSKLTSLVDDLALALKVDSVFVHPVSGKTVVGIQVPNSEPQTVSFGELVHNHDFRESQSPLTFVLGKNLKGDPIVQDLASLPHLLMAGQTGSGKSVAINSLICSLLMKATPEQVRMVLVDPKILELKVYEGIPHLITPVITEPAKAASALKWACHEMDRRYALMERAKVRHISSYNELSDKNLADDETNNVPSSLPYIVIVIDELADLMLTAPKDVEGSIQRLAQKARACGIHLVLATQRPSVDVITGVIKANLPSRIAFRVFSRGDSRTILDGNGADRLIGRGDMLFLRPGLSRLQRIQGAFVSDQEVIEFIDSIKGPENYDTEAIRWISESENNVNTKETTASRDQDQDEKWDECLDIAESSGFVSASFLQRQLKIGYNRAARIVETMEAMGLVGPADGSKPRKWLGRS